MEIVHFLFALDWRRIGQEFLVFLRIFIAVNHFVDLLFAGVYISVRHKQALFCVIEDGHANWLDFHPTMEDSFTLFMCNTFVVP
jgi:hypothetical protein